MFYIDKQRRHRKRELAMMHIGPTAIVFAAFMIVTVWSTVDSYRTIRTDQAQILGRSVDQTEAAIQGRLSAYENILRAGVGLFGASDTVTRTEWTSFIKVFDLPSRYSGVQGIGHVAVIPPADLEAHIQANRDGGFADYSVFPTGDRPIYTSIDYLEPLNERNKKAIGYDMYSDTTRHMAMDLARDTGRVTVSDVTTLIQEETTHKQPGFLMYIPVYAKGSNPQTVSERQSALRGYIYAPFRTYDLLANVSAATDASFGYQLWDGSTPNAKLFYENPSYGRINKLTGKQSASRTFRINNQTWTMAGVVDPKAIPASEQNRPLSVLWGGTLLSLFVAGFIYLLLVNRSRLLAQKEEGELQAAKDELLALASHQLRTPATGVKQYVGMLREGYAGTLTEEQQRYVEKAYASNERQLATINEMLCVARADAGIIELTIEHFDVAKLVTDVLDEQMTAIQSRQQTLDIAIAKRTFFVDGDIHYLRMAIENVITNATKYTPAGGSVTIALKRVKENIRLTVRDTGVGVHEKDYPLLFKKFSRIPNELTNKVTGSGIGLYLTQKIITAHHGTITFISKEGAGSTCTIEFPKRYTA